jgi:hypothetical protein
MWTVYGRAGCARRLAVVRGGVFSYYEFILHDRV